MNDFINLFRPTKKVVDEAGVVTVGHEYVLCDKALRAFIVHNPIRIGLYLGRVEGDSFEPSINLLNMIKNHTKEIVVVNPKQEWLFVCGRELEMKRCKKVLGRGQFKLVCNLRGEVLGYGKLVKSRVCPRFDVGDFLRRED